MTYDELKREIEALVARIDEPLADEIRRATATVEPWPGHAFECSALLPEGGCRVHVRLSAWIVPVRFQYTPPTDSA